MSYQPSTYPTSTMAPWLAWLMGLSALLGQAAWADTRDGRSLMDEVYARHEQYPYVYEEQAMILIDRNGHRNTRKARRYSRVDEDKTSHFLLLFDYPPEIYGVGLLAARHPSGKTDKGIYLPAYGQQIINSSGQTGSGSFLGSDFAVEDLTAEQLDDYQYVRERDININKTGYYVVTVYPADSEIEGRPPLRRHFIRKDNFYITRTDYFDPHGRLEKRQTHHDLKPVDGPMWRANMILMENKKERHKSLIKINRRIFSRDYVPAEIFSAEWLYENHSQAAMTASDETDDTEARLLEMNAPAADAETTEGQDAL